MLEQLTKKIETLSLKDQLQFLSEEYAGQIAFSTSFGQEDQVITDIIFKNNINIKVFTLDTARLFPETYKVWSKTLEKYGKKIETYFPDKTETEKLLSEKGPFSFYDSVENRKECCNIRKVFPLGRALKDVKLWITGLRAEQSEARSELAYFTQDTNFNTLKFNPLKDWTLLQVEKYLQENQVPQNELHSKGFISIGCQPCTRAIAAGEDLRAGRWWWEDKSKKECGLHETRINSATFNVSQIRL